MTLAIKLAKCGIGKVNPNPLVGAVIVKEKEIIGQGYHEKYGGSHAEVNAINNSIDSVEGSTLYVTLEPCCHFGKTPPCVNLIIEKGIKKVVIGHLDPNPAVCGKGVKKLREAGVEVVTGVMEDECRKINNVFIKYIKKEMPYVVLKTAMSLDGKIATYTGESKWITGSESRKKVHELRNDMVSIMVGVNTVILDNPKLTCRIPGGRNPIRIIVDSKLRVPMNSEVVLSANKVKTIVATTKIAEKEKIRTLENLGVEVLIVEDNDRGVDLKKLMIKLASMGIDGVLLEGGSSLNFSALEEKIVDKVIFYIAPKIIGGEQSKTPIGGKGIKLLSDSFKLKNLSVNSVGEDIVVEGIINCMKE